MNPPRGTDQAAVTEGVVDFVRRLDYADLDESTRMAVGTLIAGHLVAMAAAGDDEIVTAAGASLRVAGGRPQATVLATARRTDVRGAAFVNALAAQRTHDRADDHASISGMDSGVQATIVASTLALAEYRGVDTDEWQTAVAAGLAIAHVLATASAPTAFGRWSAAGTIGKIAATAAAGRLCGLDERHLTFAIGIATTGVAGLAGAAGTPRAATIAGNAAADAVAAALLAERGLTAPGELLVGTNSFSEVLGFALDAGVITDGLDSSAATVRGILDGPDHADARLHAAEEALAGRLGASSAELFLADAMSTESQSVADLVGRLVARMGR